MLVFALFACSEQQIIGPDDGTGRRGDPELGVWPEQIVFDALGTGEVAEDSLTITNHGEDTLSVEAMTMTGTSAFWLEFEPFGLEPGDALEVPIYFTPHGVENLAELYIDSNDPDARRVSVPLEGQGTQPALEIDPVEIDMGDITLDCTTEQTFTPTSTGEADLTVSDIQIVGDGFTLVWAPTLPLTLAPDERPQRSPSGSHRSRRAPTQAS